MKPFVPDVERIAKTVVLEPPAIVGTVVALVEPAETTNESVHSCNRLT